MACRGKYVDGYTSNPDEVIRALNKAAWKATGQSYSVSVVKRYDDVEREGNTYTVVYDQDSQSYIAVDFTNFPVKEWDGWGRFPVSGPRVTVRSGWITQDEMDLRIDASPYQNLQIGTAPNGTLIYTDPLSGIIFEKITGTPKDLAKVHAVEERIAIEHNVKRLVELTPQQQKLFEMNNH